VVKRGFHEKEFDHATLFKLRIFRQYAREWISVLLTRSSRQFSHLNIYDFFAGPGKDAAGNIGSPLIMLEEIEEYCRSRGSLKAEIPMRMLFNDKDEGHIASLRSEVAKRQCKESCCSFEFTALSFTEALPRFLPEMKKG
jgi:three-Cys-motif partner protein